MNTYGENVKRAAIAGVRKKLKLNHLSLVMRSKYKSSMLRRWGTPVFKKQENISYFHFFFFFFPINNNLAMNFL